MDQGILLEKIKQIRDLADSIIKEGDLTEVKFAKDDVKMESKRKSKRKVDVSGPVRGLLSQGFFDQGKTDTDVIKKLKKQALNVKRKSVSVTLMRFVRKDLLEREGGGNKKDPWRYKEKSKLNEK